MYVSNDFKIREFILRYIKYGYNINVIWQTACMEVNPVTANNFAFIFGCTPVCRASGFGIIVLLHVHRLVNRQNPHVEPSESSHFILILEKYIFCVTQKRFHGETLLMSTNNICFLRERRTRGPWATTLT